MFRSYLFRGATFVAACVAAVAVAEAQPIGGGVKVGVPFSDAFSIAGTGFDAKKPAYTVGPFVEVRLPANFAIEFGALYEGLRFGYRSVQQGVATDVSTKSSSWQFPLLLKYRIGEGRVRPFVEGGVAAYRIGDIQQEIVTQFPEDVRDVLSRVGNSFVNGGGVVGGGVEFRAGPLRIAPELRFTRWAIRQEVGTDVVSLRLEESRTHVFLSVSF